MAIFSNKTSTSVEATADKKKAESKTSSSQTSLSGHPSVLFGPRLSEKSSKLADSGKYVFNVRKSANKIEIKKAVEIAFKVNVTQVNILNTQGKTRNSGRVAGRTSGFRKAIVTLKAGQKIEGATETI